MISKYNSAAITHYVREYLIVIIFNTGIAFLIWTIMPNEDSFLLLFIRAQFIGLSICTIMNIFFRSLKPSKPLAQGILLIICLTLGSLTGVYSFDFFFDSQLKEHFYNVLFVGFLFGVIISYFFIIQEKYSQLKIEKQEEELKSISLEKNNILANLKLLQAQIEPHFLFNSLSNVLSLLDTDPLTGKKMLENLTQYLRTSLKHTRNEKNTLKQEMETIKSYLDINKIRMGERLKYKIEIPQDLYNMSFPPMLIQPIVENSIKHGIEPKVSGGSISIKILRQTKNKILEVEICDTGAGIDSEISFGLGLKNIKSRLKALYPEKSFINFETNTPTGLKVTIGVPYENDNSNNC